MKTLPRLQSRSTGTHAAGTTLSEVLISLLVMSIGVVSLATLFPISVLRSVQATQLTNAANLRYNVEGILGVVPQLYSIGANWQPATTYNSGDLITPSAYTSLKSPPVVFYCTAGGTSGTIEPNWDFKDLNTTNDGGATWQTYRLKNYVIDPLGKWNVETSYRNTSNGDFFGNNGTNPVQVIRAFPGLGAPSSSITTDDAAADVATLPDSWITQVDSNQVSYSAGGTACSLGDLASDLSQTTPLSPAAFLPSRIVLFDITGKISHVRPLSGISGTVPTQTFTWPAAYGPLPSSFTPVRARVETKERRYTWMLSVRRGYSGTAFMDVVVFFRRPFSGKDEQIFPATFTAVTDPGYDQQPGVSGVDDDGKNGTDDSGELGWPGSDDSARNWVIVEYNSTGDKPFYKKGSYVCDATNLRWYRILDFVEGTTPASVTPAGITAQSQTSGYDRSVRLTIENKILQDGSTGGGAMLMRGIVDVFPIPSHLTWEN